MPTFTNKVGVTLSTLNHAVAGVTSNFTLEYTIFRISTSTISGLFGTALGPCCAYGSPGKGTLRI